MHVTIYAPQGHLFPRAVPTGVDKKEGQPVRNEFDSLKAKLLN